MIEKLKMNAPYSNGVWNRENLIDYLIWNCDTRFNSWIREYFANYTDDMKLADLLFEIVLDDDFDGSDARMGAAYFISKLSENVLKEKRDLLAKAQQNEVFACRPLSYTDTIYDWF